MNWHKTPPIPLWMPYNSFIDTKELQMTEQELIELWGDGSEFGLSPNDELFMNNAFREVAVKFALVVADKAYWNGIERAGMDND